MLSLVVIRAQIINRLASFYSALGLKFTNGDAYNDIAEKLKESEPERKKFINKFIEPIKDILKEQGFKYL